MERLTKIKEIVSILMESSLYLSCPLKERMELVHSLASRITGSGLTPGISGEIAD